MWCIVLLIIVEAAKKNILLSAGYYMKGHSTPFKVLAMRLSQDPEFNCFVVAEPELKDFWQDVNCTILFIQQNEDIEKYRLFLDSAATSSEKGTIQILEEVKQFLIAGLPYWEKSDMFKTIQDIGIDMAICDPFCAQCLIAVHKLKIPKSVYMYPCCYSGGMGSIYSRDTNRIPFENVNWPSENIGFFDRMINTLKYKLFKLFIGRLMNEISYENAILIAENDWRSNSLYKTESLYVQPCIPFFNFPEELPPNYIHSGPLVDRILKPLPKSVLDFINLYKQIIYVSFGSVSITYDISQIILMAHKLPKIGFVISYARNSLKDNDIPENCLILAWVPQIDLLATGKVNVFITHSGWNSISQSLFHAVPMVTCGWMFDRFDSSFLADFRKVGKMISNREEFKADNLLKVTQEVLNNPVYKQNALKYSKMLQKWDSEGKIIDAIKLYFEMGIENLVLDNYYDLYWFQRNYLDIYAFGLAIVILTIFVITFVVRMIWKAMKMCFKLSQNIKEKEN